MPDQCPATILSVDDREVNRYVRGRALRAAGFDVVEAETGADALRLAAETSPALVLLDVRLPDIDGFAVCDRLKSDPKTASIPVLHITAGGRIESDLAEALAHRSDGYLHEPIALDTLVATVTAIVHAREAERRQREAEERARKVEREAAAVLEHIADPVFALDREWRFTWASRAAGDLFDEAPERLIGRSLWEYFPDPEAPTFRRACEEALAANKPTVCEHFSPARGRWYEDHIYPAPNGLVAESRDITARKAAESEILASRERLEAVFENLPEPVFVIDAHGHLRTVNSAFRDQYLAGAGVPPDLPALLDMFKAFTPERVEIPPEQRPVARSLKGETCRNFEMILERAGGGSWFVSINSTPVRDPGGNVIQVVVSCVDISGRKRTEQIAGFHEAFDHLPVTIGVLEGPDHRLAYLNPAAARIWPQAQQAYGLPAADAFAEDWKPYLPHLDRVYRTGETVQIDAARFAGVTPSGSGERYLNIICSPLWRGGKVAGVITTTLDITRSLKTEQVFRRYIELNPVGVVVGSVVGPGKGRLSLVNDAYLKLIGYTRAEFEAGEIRWDRITPPESKAADDAGIAELLQHGRATPYEKEYIHKDGHRIPILVAPVAVPGTDEVLSFVLDLTERKRAEEAVRASERRLSAVIENLAEGLIIVDPRGETLHWNRTALAMHGFENEDDTLRTISAALDQYEVFSLDGTPLPREQWPVPRLLRGERLTELELVVSHKTRPWERIFSYGGSMVRNEDGTLALGLLTIRDVTERKRAEQQLRQAQKLESIGLLAGGIAHDFNNLLTGIMGNASLVLEEVEPGPRAGIQEVIRNAERAAHLTRQLLAYSGKGQFVVRDVDLSAAVNEISDLVQFSIPKSVDLVLNLQKRLPPISIDPGQLQQVLMNLVINAGEAIGEGKPGKIYVTTGVCDSKEPFRDALGERVEPGRYVCIEVKDTGSGIDPQTREKIFEPFFSTKFTGRGLGLAAVSGILRSLRGAVMVESTPGCGTSFRVFFHAAEPHRRAPSPSAGQSRGTILVVDDEASVREFIAAVLRKRGYSVLTASDGREALAVLEKEKVALVAAVLDIVMPVMGANDMLPELKVRQPDLKVLLTSGYSESEARRLCAAYPDAAFIQKPYTAREIARAVEDVVGAPS